MTEAQKTKKIFDGKYEILGIVGRGARSVVYHARNILQGNAEVALKVLVEKKGDDTRSGELLRKEALAMISCRHPYVVRLDDFHSVGTLCYLSMEYAPEKDMRIYAQKFGGKLPVEQVEQFMQQAAQALSFIHKAGIVHRDVKPENILVINDKEIRIADFGVALLPGETSTTQELSAGIGTLSYLSPEVLEGKAYAASADIYSLGVTFFEMLSGVQPFDKASMLAQLEIRRDESLPNLADLAPEAPAYLVQAILKCMHFEAKDRFTSTQDLLQALNTKQVATPLAVEVPLTPIAAEIPPVQIEEPKEIKPPVSTSKIATFKESPITIPSQHIADTVPAFIPPTESVEKIATRELLQEMTSVRKGSKRRSLTTRLDTIENVAEALGEISNEDLNDDLDIFDEPESAPYNPPLFQPPPPQTSGNAAVTSLLEPVQKEKFELGPVPDATKQIAEAVVSIDDKQLSTRRTVAIDREMVEQIRAQAAAIRPGLPIKKVALAYIGAGFLGLFILIKIVGLFTHRHAPTAPTNQSALSEPGPAMPDAVSAPAAIDPALLKVELSFPLLPAGIYTGTIRDLVPGQEQTLTLISLKDHKKMAIIVGLEGWTPRIVSLEDKKVNDKLRVAANGYILDMTAIAKDGELVGSYKNVLSGQYGVWKVKPAIIK